MLRNFFENNHPIQYADDDTTSVGSLVRMRISSLTIGLFLGLLLSFFTSMFEKVLSEDIKVVFFIPLVVYMADAVGTQTQSIYIRDLRTKKASFKKYLVKESLLGVILGILTGVISGGIVMVWFGVTQLALAVALGMIGAVTSAPVIALLVTEMLELEHTDPAVGAGPIATVIQDTVSVLIYGFVASLVIL